MSSLVKSSKNVVKQILSNTEVINPFRNLFKEIEFETLTYCNRKCFYCPNIDFERFGEEGDFFMKEDVFTTLIEQLKNMGFNGLIAPHLYGEPMSDPRLNKWMKHIKSEIPDCRIKIVTNGDFLDKKSYRDLINSGVDIIYLSKHSKKFKKKTQELLDSLSNDEISKNFSINDFYTDFKTEDQTMFTNRGGDIDLKDTALPKKKPPVNCGYATYPVINTFGDLILCCQDFQNNYVFGNIMERDLYDIWYDPENIKIRKRIFKSKFDLQICKDCVM